MSFKSDYNFLSMKIIILSCLVLCLSAFNVQLSLFGETCIPKQAFGCGICAVRDSYCCCKSDEVAKLLTFGLEEYARL
jgi:hypothetical protein